MPNIEVRKNFLTPWRLLLAVIVVILIWNLTGLF